MRRALARVNCHYVFVTIFSDPPYVTQSLIDAFIDRLGSDFTLAEFDCKHMVAGAKPAETAAIIRGMLR